MSAAPLVPPIEFAVREKTFRLVYRQQLTNVEGGFIQTLDRGTPVWVAEYTTAPLNDLRYNEAIAFCDALEGSANSFLGTDPRRRMPYAYKGQPIGNDPWTQTGQAAPRLTAIDYALSQVTLDRLQTGAVISKGDQFGVYFNPGWLLFRIATAAVVTGTHSVTLTVKPRPSTSLLGAVLPLNIVYRRPAAEMKMIGNFNEQDSVESLPVLSFKAVQFIDRTLP
jgi:hypothetical protein